jgi:RimJ/RimL family protein N-acetyltransferase
MRIEAKGCVLRSVRDADVPAITKACLDPEIVHWLPHLPQPYGVDDARAFIAQTTEGHALGREVTLAIVDDDDALLGMVGVRLTEDPPTVGYWLAPEARGRGLATAATRALSDWTFATLAPVRLALHAEPANHASRRVAEKCGFARVPGIIKGGDGRDLWVFELQRPAGP